MEDLNRYSVEATKRTPRIILEQGRINIFGRSIPENPGEFYRPVYEWISKNTVTNNAETVVELGFEYINTSSTKWVYNIIKKIAGLSLSSTKIRIIWYYDRGDEDMCELGFILKSLVECPFIVMETESIESMQD